MSDVGTWSVVAEKNTKPAPNGWQENMLPSDVNNSARENMAAIKRMSLDFPYFGIGGKVVWVSDTSFSIEDDELDTEYRKYYTDGRQVKVKYLNGTAPEYVTATVLSSLYSANVSTITLRFDSETDKLPTTTYAVMIGLRYEDVKSTVGPSMLGMVLPYTADSVKIPFGMGFANGEPFDPIIYSELALLYKTGTNEDGDTYLYGQKDVNGRIWPLKPDVRGYFPRFLDDRLAPVKPATGDTPADTRIDPEAPRVVGSMQKSAVGKHGHAVNVFDGGASGGDTSSYPAGSTYAASASRGLWNGSTNRKNTRMITESGGNPETRPSNVALPGLLVMYGGYASAALISPEQLVASTMQLVTPMIDAIQAELNEKYNNLSSDVQDLIDDFDTVVTAGVEQINDAGAANIAAMDVKVTDATSQAERSKYYADNAASSTVGKQSAIKTIVVSVQQTDWDVNKVAVVRGLPIKSINDTVWVAPYALTDDNFKAYAEAQIRGTTIAAGASDNSGTLSLKCINVPAPGTTAIAMEVSIANASN